MQQCVTLRVAPVDRRLRQSVLELQVLPTQRAWVGKITDALADLAQCPDSDSMAILRGDTPVGHYRIDPHPRSVAGHDFALPTLGLRAFFVDARWQRQGLGAAALRALFVDLAERHPAARQLALTVDCNNHAAQRLYRRNGFVDSDELYHGGHSGSHNLLVRGLP